MSQPTIENLFDNETTLISSATYSGQKLTIEFNQDVSPLQAFAAIIQSGHSWLLQNTDVKVNASATQPSINSTSRNGLNKEQTNISCQFYIPLTHQLYHLEIDQKLKVCY